MVADPIIAASIRWATEKELEKFPVCVPPFRWRSGQSYSDYLQYTTRASEALSKSCYRYTIPEKVHPPERGRTTGPPDGLIQPENPLFWTLSYK
jgi:hypothetical protein